MKTYKTRIILIMIIASLLLIISCTQSLTSEEQKYSEICHANNHKWMKMQPMKEGKDINGQSCWGCMPDMSNHICNMNEYEEFVNAKNEK